MALPSLLNAVKDLDRLRQIVGVLVSHGFGEVVTRTGFGGLVRSKAAEEDVARLSAAERTRLVLQDLGPSFIKLGQIVSTRPDLVPQSFIAELKKLQDEVPPVSYESIKTEVETGLGGTLEDLFESFEEEPLATASIGQVHRARLRTPQGVVDVVVKVQRPGVAQTVARDLDLLYLLAHAVERSIPDLKIYAPVKMVAEFDKAITQELDFLIEAENGERFTDNFATNAKVHFPLVYRGASSKRVLTQEFLDGDKVYGAIAKGASGHELSQNMIQVLIQQIFEDGFFHADPHPGNIIITGPPSDPVIGLIDLGLVGRLTPQMRDRVIDLMVAAFREDYSGMADALYAIGRPTKKVDRRAFEQEVTELSQKYLGKKLEQIEVSALIADFAMGAQKFKIEMPADFLMVGRALMTVEGVGKEIAPELDVFEEIRPYFMRLLAQRYSPERMTQEGLRTLLRLSSAANEMPIQVQELLEDLRKGSFSVQAKQVEMQHAADQLGRRVFSGLTVSSMVLGSSILAAADHYILAGVLGSLGLTWVFWHQALLLWLGRKWNKRDR